MYHFILPFVILFSSHEISLSRLNAYIKFMIHYCQKLFSDLTLVISGEHLIRWFHPSSGDIERVQYKIKTMENICSVDTVVYQTVPKR